MSTPLEIAVYQTRDGLHRARVRWTDGDGVRWQGYGPEEYSLANAVDRAMAAWVRTVDPRPRSRSLERVTRCR